MTRENELSEYWRATLLDTDFPRLSQNLNENGPQRHGRDWLVQQLQTAGARLAQRFGIGIAADEEGRDLSAECAAQPLNDLDPGFAVRQTKIGNDQIGPFL